MIRQLAYVSSASQPQTTVLLQGIARQSRENNAAKDITGLLFASGGWFFQVIEGQGRAIETLFRAIARDPRHCGLTVLFDVEVERRSFAGEPLMLTLLGHPHGSILFSTLLRGVETTLDACFHGGSSLGERLHAALADRGIVHA